MALLRHELRVSRTPLILVLIAVLLLSFFVRHITINFISDDPASSPDFTVAASLIDEDRSMLGQLLMEYLKGVRYVSAIHDDSFDEAMRRMEQNDIVVALRLPSRLFEETRTGSQIEPVELWLNPRMPAESRQIAILVRQYATAFNYLYSGVFGYQKLYVELGGDEDESWKKATNHSMNALTMYLDRDRYVKTGELLSFNILLHVLSGILIIFALLPAMGVLAGTIRITGTAYEDRLLLSLGPNAPLVTRLLLGVLWWAILLLPPLLALRLSHVIQKLMPIMAILFFAYLAMALFMLAIGRIKAPGVTVLQMGWLLFFLFLVLGGIIYPTSLFPDWLNKTAAYTPFYSSMRSLYRALFLEGTLVSKQVWATAWPVVPAFLSVLLFGRRRV